MKKFTGALAALLLTGVSAAHATSITFGDFSNLNGLQLNGITDDIHTCNPGGNTGCDAVTDSLGRNVLRLTNNLSQSGSAFSQSTITLANNASFSAAFSFRISNPQGISDEDGQGADGIVFAVQTVSNTAGGLGQGIGYDGLGHSVGIEFDTWNNGAQDANNGNHVGIDINGSVFSNPLRVVSTTNPGNGDPFGRMNNGTDWFAWVDYNGLTDLLEVRLSNTSSRPTAAFLSKIIDLVPVLGSPNAYVGFTSGTGAAGGYHDILGFQFNDDYAPIEQVGVPAPGALALVGLGLFGIGGLRRKKLAA